MKSIEVTADVIERKNEEDEQALKRKRGLQRALKDSREKLTSSAGLNRAFENELTSTFAHNRAGATGPLVLLALMPASAAYAWAPIEMIVMWLGLMVIVLSAYFLHCRYVTSLPPEEMVLKRWTSRFVVLEFCTALTWCALIMMTGAPPTESSMLFILFSMLLFSAVSTTVSAAMPMVVWANLFTVAMAIGALIVVTNTGINYSYLMMVFGGILFFVVLSTRLHRALRDSLTFRAEKDALIGELEQEKARSDEARKRAEDANLAKSRFLATMSHELRTPLNAILGFSEVMKSELFGAHVVPQYKEYSNDIYSSGEHLLSLINEVLDLSRIEAGRYSLSEESVDLGGLVEDCRHMLELRARKRELKLVELYEPDLPRIWADERAIRQVVLNLLSNAIKFTPQGSTITIKVGWTSRGGQYVSVRDNGPGIPEEEIPLVMTTFGRGSQALKSAEPGTGLGLPIVKGLVELHGGSFMLHSKLREGTEVIATFPPQRVMQALAPVTEKPARRRESNAA